MIYDSIVQLGKVDGGNLPPQPEGLEDEGYSDEVTKFRISFEKSRIKRTPETATKVVTMSDFGYAVDDGVEQDANLARVVELVKAGRLLGLSQRQAEKATELHYKTIWKKVVIGLDRGLIRADEVKATFSFVPAEVQAAMAVEGPDEF